MKSGFHFFMIKVKQNRYSVDFHATVLNQFPILQGLCQLSIATINGGVETSPVRFLLNLNIFDDIKQVKCFLFWRIDHF